MQNIKEILEQYKIAKMDDSPISERHELISKFTKRLNENRIVDGLKPLSCSFVNFKMAQAGLKTNYDLYWFYAYCNEAINFDKTWWWSLKSK